MSHEVPCPKCGSSNPHGSRFCNSCGHQLPPSTTIICPQCQTRNPRDRVFCDNCGKRLLPSQPEKEEPKAGSKASPEKFSLPEREPGQSSPLDPQALPDWLSTGQIQPPEDAEQTGNLPSLEELAPLRKTTDDLPNWLVGDSTSSIPPFEPPREITTDHFLELLEASDDDEPGMARDEIAQSGKDADLPDWLSDVVKSPTSQLSERPSSRIPKPPPAKPAPDEWLTELGPARTGALKDDTPAEPEDAEFPGWLQDLGSPQTGQLDEQDDEPASDIFSTSEFAGDVLGGQELPDWLQELSPATPETPPARPTPSSKEDVPVSNIFQSDEFAAEVRQALEDEQEELPDWLQELGPAQTAPLQDDANQGRPPERPHADWLTELGPAATGHLPDSGEDLSDLAAFLGQDLDDTADSGLPDWLQDLGPTQTDNLHAAEDAGFQATSSDWLAELDKRGQPEEADDEVSSAWTDASDISAEWLADLAPADEAGAAPDERADRGMTDWFRESTAPPSPPRAAADKPPAHAQKEEPVDEFSVDWLAELGATADLRREAPPDTPAPPPAAPAPDDEDLFDDWLDKPESEPEADLFSLDEAEDAEELVDDWLADLGAEAALAAEEEQLPAADRFEFAADEADADDADDWLTTLEEDTFASVQTLPEEEEPDAFAVEEAFVGDATGELDDWLADLERFETPPVETPPPAETAAPTETQTSEVDDWLADLEPAFEAEPLDTAMPETADEPHDAAWLADLGAPHTHELSAPDDAGAAQSDELPDWLAELGPPQTSLLTPSPVGTTGTPADETGDLLSLPDAEPGADLPDWLFGEDAAETPEPADQSAALPKDEPFADLPPDDASLVDEQPDWLAEISELGAEAFDAEVEAPIEAATADSAPTSTEPAIKEPAAPSSPEVPDEIPTTFEGLFGSEPAVEEEPPPPPGELGLLDFDDVEQAELPDWLTQLGPPTASETGRLLTTQSEPPEDMALVQADVPDWVSRMRPESSQHHSSLPGLAGPEPGLADGLEAIPEELIGAELPDWLEDVSRTGYLDSIDDDGNDDLAADIPDWLQVGLTDSEREEILGTETPDTSGALNELLAALPPARAAQDDLVQTELPEWVQAMKPRELSPAGAAAAEKGPVEETGPLSGIRGVLQAEAPLAGTSTSTFVNGLTVTTEQQQQAALLRQLQYAEAALAVPTTDAPMRRAGLLRFVLALLLLTAVLLGLLGQSLLRSTPVQPTAPLEAVNAAVQAAAGQPVLVAFDYSPAMSGELTPQVEMLLAQLHANDSQLLTVSQSAAGVGLGARLPYRTATERPLFIPGEAIGLRQLASCLQAPCRSVAGHYLSEPVQETLTDVALILVFTSDRDSLTNWIEQVGATSDLPLLLGVPEALAPVMQPYLASGQVTGMVAGLEDTAVYSQTFRAQTGPDLSSQLSARHWAQIVVVVVLLGGMVLAMRRRKPAPTPEKP